MKMSRILLLFVVCVTVRATHKHHPKFPKVSQDYETTVPLLKVACSSDNELRRNEFIQKSKCGEPKEVFVKLERNTAHEQISPGAVWVKRCVGLCDYHSCVATKKEIKYIPIRIFNLKTNKEICSSYPVEEHLSCGCCSESANSCATPRVFDPRKCACRCPNRKEKRNCKPSLTMRWNPSKCTCEQKLRRRNPL